MTAATPGREQEIRARADAATPLTPVGYFCDHSDEPYNARTHHGWEWVEDEGFVFQHKPETISSHGGPDQPYLKPEDRERRCPRAVPVYAAPDVDAAMATAVRRALEDAANDVQNGRVQYDTAVTEQVARGGQSFAVIAFVQLTIADHLRTRAAVASPARAQQPCGDTKAHPAHTFMRMEVLFQCPGVGDTAPPADEETHVVADDSDDPEHIDDCPGCAAFSLTGHITAPTREQGEEAAR